MNTTAWIQHFEASGRQETKLPDVPCSLPETLRRPLAESIAIFQLGESGGGTRLRRYARAVAPLEHFRGYQRAIDLFITEEQRHAEMLAHTLRHLRGYRLTRQWTNSLFRRMRFLANLEFGIQILLTAELIAEVYYGALLARVRDPVVKVVARRILRDEIKHLAFQREFLAERVATFTPVGRWLWRCQFEWLHRAATRVVAWDHRRCLAALGMSQADFRGRAAKALNRFQAGLDRLVAAFPAPVPAAPPISLPAPDTFRVQTSANFPQAARVNG